MNRPVVTVVHVPPGVGDAADGDGPVTLDQTDHDLTGTEVTVRVRTAADLAVVLDAAMRGATVTLELAADAPADPAFLDQLHRVADVRERDAAGLDGDVAALLELLAEGLTVAHAARRLNRSPRSAYRLLAEARSILGVATTAEAVLAVRTAR